MFPAVLVKGNLRAARKGRLPVPRSLYRALRQAQPDIHFAAYDTRVPINTHTRTLFGSEIFAGADVTTLSTLISGDAAGATQPFTKVQVYAVAAFTNGSATTVKIRETRYWARAPSYQSLAADINFIQNPGAWESQGAGGSLGAYDSVPDAANNQYWNWPEAGTVAECAYFWTLYRPARRARVRVVKPGQTVQFVYKFNVYLDELRWNNTLSDPNNAQVGVQRRAIYELQTETGLAFTGATKEEVRSGIALPGLLFHRLVTKWKYRWAFANRPSITGSNLATGLTRASFASDMHGWLSRKTAGVGVAPSYQHLDGDTIVEQGHRNEESVRNVNINFHSAADGSKFVPDVQ